MAIDKSRTSPAMKAGVIILIVAFVAGFGVIGIGGLTSGGPVRQQQSGSQAGTAALQQISQQSQAAIAPNEQALKANPKDYDLLKKLGDQYYDYASQIAQAAPNSGVDLAIWRQAVGYYQRALAVKAGDPAVETDMAISQFYGGDAAGAIATVEQARKTSPKFGPAAYNAGVFYRASGDSAKAIAAFDAYLKLEPDGASAAQAKQFLTELRSAGSQAAPGSAPATGN